MFQEPKLCILLPRPRDLVLNPKSICVSNFTIWIQHFHKPKMLISLGEEIDTILLNYKKTFQEQANTILITILLNIDFKERKKYFLLNQEMLVQLLVILIKRICFWYQDQASIISVLNLAKITKVAL